MRRPSSSCAPASGWPTRCARSGPSCTSRRPALLRLSEQERNRRIDLLRLAESLGAETVTLDGPTAAAALIEYAQTRRATRIIVGAPKRRGWRALWRRSTATALLLGAQGLRRRYRRRRRRARRANGGDHAGAGRVRAAPLRWKRYLAAAAISAACTAVAFGMFPYLELSNLVMVYLLGVVVAGLRIGRLPSVLTAVLNVLCFDFFFVPPRFHVRGLGRAVRADVRRHADRCARHRDADGARAPADASRRCPRAAHGAALRDEPRARRDARQRQHGAARGQARRRSVPVRVRRAAAGLRPGASATPRKRRWTARIAARIWPSRSGSPTTAGARASAPIRCRPRRRSICRLAMDAAAWACWPCSRAIARRVLLPEQRHLLETFAGQIGLALERAGLAETAAGARVAAERETLRNTLLASISHDLRTPLAAMAGAASTLVARGSALDDATRRSSRARSRRKRATCRSSYRRCSTSCASTRAKSCCGATGSRSRISSSAALEHNEERLEDHRVEIALPARSAARVGRCDARRSSVHEPIRERRQVHARGHADHASGPRRGRRRARHRRRQRAGPSRRGSRAAVRQVPARHSGRHDRRRRARPVDLPRDRASARRHDRGRPRPGGGARIELTLPTREPGA